MAVTKSLGNDDKNKRSKFISKGQGAGEYTNVLVRLPTSMLFQIDNKKAPWQARNTWIVDALNEKLNPEQ